MPNLTDDELREMLAVAERADWRDHNSFLAFHETFDPPAVKAILTELLRLREERRVLAEAIKARDARETAYTKGVVTQEQFNVLILKDQAAQEKALALLDPKGDENNARNQDGTPYNGVGGDPKGDGGGA